MSTADFNATVEAFTHRLLGCEWGRRIATADYPQLCDAKASQRLALHGEDGTRVVQLCTPHRDFVLMETDPSKATAEGRQR